jgi:hypothetical protein
MAAAFDEVDCVVEHRCHTQDIAVFTYYAKRSLELNGTEDDNFLGYGAA